MKIIKPHAQYILYETQQNIEREVLPIYEEEKKCIRQEPEKKTQRCNGCFRLYMYTFGLG